MSVCLLFTMQLTVWSEKVHLIKLQGSIPKSVITSLFLGNIVWNGLGLGAKDIVTKGSSTETASSLY